MFVVFFFYRFLPLMDRFLRRRDGNFNQSENIIGPNNYAVIPGRTKNIRKHCTTLRSSGHGFYEKIEMWKMKLEEESKDSYYKFTGWTQAMGRCPQTLTLEVSLRARINICVVRLVVRSQWPLTSWPSIPINK